MGGKHRNEDQQQYKGKHWLSAPQEEPHEHEIRNIQARNVHQNMDKASHVQGAAVGLVQLVQNLRVLEYHCIQPICLQVELVHHRLVAPARVVFTDEIGDSIDRFIRNFQQSKQKQRRQGRIKRNRAGREPAHVLEEIPKSHSRQDEQ